MKFFLDQPSPEDEEALVAAGLCDGVLLPDQDESALGAWRARGRGALLVDLRGQPDEDLLARAREVTEVGDGVVAGLAFGVEALRIARLGFDEGVATSLLGCSRPFDVLAAARAGATFVALDLTGIPGGHEAAFRVIEDALAILERHDLETELLVSGAQSDADLAELAVLGVAGAIVSPAVLRSALTPRAAPSRAKVRRGVH